MIFDLVMMFVSDVLTQFVKRVPIGSIKTSDEGPLRRSLSGAIMYLIVTGGADEFAIGRR